MKQVFCINDGEGDYWYITPGKVYTVLKVNSKYPLYTTEKEDGTIIENTVPRILIKDDMGQGWYPIFCFKVLDTIKSVEDLL